MRHFAASLTAARWKKGEGTLQVVHECVTLHIPGADLGRNPGLAQSNAEGKARRLWKEKDGYFDHRASVIDLDDRLNGIGFKIVAGT